MRPPFHAPAVLTTPTLASLFALQNEERCADLWLKGRPRPPGWLFPFFQSEGGAASGPLTMMAKG